MYTSLTPPLSKALVKPAVWLLSVYTVLLFQCCKADQPLSLSLISSDQAQVQWTSGPADASLGALADITIPKGYRFTDATGAALLLTRMNNPVPTGLVGILAPESGQWWAVLEYRDIGYLKDAAKTGMDTKAILQAISDRAQNQNEARRIHNLPLITSVNWALAPAFDANTHVLEWAVLAKTQSGQVVNHTMRLLGRQGILDATVVEAYQAGAALDLDSLRGLMKNISFKAGQRYADYQAGDQISGSGWRISSRVTRILQLPKLMTPPRQAKARAFGDGMFLPVFSPEAVSCWSGGLASGAARRNPCLPRAWRVMALELAMATDTDTHLYTMLRLHRCRRWRATG